MKNIVGSKKISNDDKNGNNVNNRKNNKVNNYHELGLNTVNKIYKKN
jgi:hypothetical protein